MSKAVKNDVTVDKAVVKRLLEALREERAAAADDAGTARRLVADLQIHQLELEEQNRELRRTQQALEGSRSRYAELYDWAPVGYCGLDRNGYILEPNLTLARLLGTERTKLLNRPLSRFLAPGQHATILAHIATVMRSGERQSLDLNGLPADGAPSVLLLESESSTAPNGDVFCRSVLLDVTERRRSAKALTDALARLEMALERGDICLYESDLNTGDMQVDDRCLSMLGYTASEVHLDHQAWRNMIHPEDLHTFDAQEDRIRRGESGRFDCEYRVRHRDGPWRWIADRAQVVERIEGGEAPRVAGGRIDVTRRKLAELNLEYLADHDALTGLLNRRGIDQFHTHIHAQATRSQEPYCIALLDLDHFKRVNDLHGHAAGDRMLRSVADALLAGLRNADWLGRWGGEEFLICLPGASETRALAAVERLREQVAAQSIRWAGDDIRITVSAGLAACRLGQDTPATVLAQADQALYRAKAEGRNRTVLASTGPEMGALPIAMMVSDALRSARVHAAYQPIVSLQDRSLVGEESLARIVDENDRVLAAAAFIDVAHELGLLSPIDDILFRAALQRRQSLIGDGAPLHLIVNLSTDLLHDRAHAARLAESIPPLEENAPAPARLVIAIDARLGEPDGAKMREMLAPFLERGCLLAIDEWGQGESASRLLTQLPVSFVRIPGNLVRGAGESKHVRALIAGIQHTAAALDITCIAKQIENEATAALLADLGVAWGQGFWFWQPEPRDLVKPAGA